MKNINGMQYEKEESFISSRHKSSELFINVLDTHFFKSNLCILNYHSTYDIGRFLKHLLEILQ